MGIEHLGHVGEDIVNCLQILAEEATAVRLYLKRLTRAIELRVILGSAQVTMGHPHYEAMKLFRESCFHSWSSEDTFTYQDETGQPRGNLKGGGG